ncbi:MAG TPA: MFS transporter [Arachnia sp.]|nr:MFS transporter [Arachnia sp.]
MTIWTRTFVLATVVNFLVSLVFFMLMVTMATYAGERFSAADSMAGLAASIFIVGALVVRPFAGRFLDVVGRRRMLLIGLGVFTVASFLYVPADNLGLLLAVRMLHGAGLGASHTAIAASIMTVLPPARRSEGMGYFTLSGTVATAIGPAIALAVLQLGAVEWLFGFGAVLSTAAFLLAFGLRFPGPGRDGGETGPAGDRAHSRASGFVERSVLPIASMMLLLGIAFTGVLTYVSTHAAALDLTGALSGFFLVYSGVIAVSRLFVGRLHDARGDNVIVYPALVSMAAGLVVLALASSGVALLVAGGLLGLGMGTLLSSAHVIAVSVAPLHRVGLATSTLFIMMDLGVGLGPLALGPVIAQWGLAVMYLGLSALVLVAAGVYHLGHGRRRGGAGSPSL